MRLHQKVRSMMRAGDAFLVAAGVPGTVAYARIHGMADPADCLAGWIRGE
jgi:hypothetical protein